MKEQKIHKLGKYGGTIAECGKIAQRNVSKFVFDRLITKYKCKRCIK